MKLVESVFDLPCAIRRQPRCVPGQSGWMNQAQRIEQRRGTSFRSLRTDTTSYAILDSFPPMRSRVASHSFCPGAKQRRWRRGKKQWRNIGKCDTCTVRWVQCLLMNTTWTPPVPEDQLLWCRHLFCANCLCSYSTGHVSKQRLWGP